MTNLSLSVAKVCLGRSQPSPESPVDHVRMSFRTRNTKGCKMALVGSQLLIHRSDNKCLSRLLRRHLAFHRQTTAPSGIRADVAVRTDHVPAQYLKSLKRTAYFFLDATAKLDGYWLPLNFGGIPDLIRAHFASPLIVPCAKRRTELFVPSVLVLRPFGGPICRAIG